MTRSEQRLAFVLGLVVVGGLVVLSLNKLKAWKAAVDQRAQELAVEVEEAQELLSHRDFWQQRAKWLEEKQPEYTKASEAISKLLNEVDELAAKHGVSIPIKQPNEEEQRQGMVAVVVTLKVTGEMKPVMSWLHEMQRPDQFLAVPALNIIPDKEDPSKIEMNLRLEKWMRSGKS
jgi:hypothetical protein